MPSVTARAPLQSSSPPASTPAAADDAGFGVYVHWPFCASKCPYCDFNSHVRDGGIDEARFLDGYLRELEYWSRIAHGREVTSIFFGGGTPSLMSARAVGAILNAIARNWAVQDSAEVTLEANPSSVEAGRFRGYRAAGVNRVSLGVQSLDDAQLRALGRLHTAEEARAATDVARRTFDRFSFDLIYARPGQTLEAWRSELGQALGLAGRHLSLYQLTIEQGTPFAALHARGKLHIPDDEAACDFYELTQEMTERAGLPAYEISNHAVQGEESRHNLTYWRYGQYVGIGPGAHGRVQVDGVRRATTTERNPERWAALVEAGEHGIAESVALSPLEQADEALLMGLRLQEGLDLDRLARHTGLRPSIGALQELAQLGLVEMTAKSTLRSTTAGRMVLNEIVLRLARSFTPAERVTGSKN
jgi:oxygen-independent coproporphyrinogen-3 oxidase